MVNTNAASFSQDVINVNTNNGNAAQLSREEYNSLKETFYLLNIPGMKERLLQAKDFPVEKCDEFEW